MKNTLLEQIVHWAAGGAATALGGWLIRQHDPFYHPGWARDHFGWLLFALVVAFIAILASLWTRGLCVVGALAALAGIAFGVLYENEAFQHGIWPLLAWLLHLLVIALLIGVLAGLASKLVFRVKN